MRSHVEWKTPENWHSRERVWKLFRGIKALETDGMWTICFVVLFYIYFKIMSNYISVYSKKNHGYKQNKWKYMKMWILEKPLSLSTTHGPTYLVLLRIQRVSATCPRRVSSGCGGQGSQYRTDTQSLSYWLPRRGLKTHHHCVQVGMCECACARWGQTAVRCECRCWVLRLRLSESRSRSGHCGSLNDPTRRSGDVFLPTSRPRVKLFLVLVAGKSEGRGGRKRREICRLREEGTKVNRVEVGKHKTAETLAKRSTKTHLDE